MQKTIFGIFTDRQRVEECINRLKDEGFDAQDISIVMKDRREAQEMGENTGTDIVGGAASGATTGALLGGLAGLVASFMLPGLGAFFIGGPLAAALGLTGAAASTVSGAATGAVAGGLLGALTGFGLSREDAKHYEERVNEGAILVAVPVNERQESMVERVFTDYDATDIKSVAYSQESMRDEPYERSSYAPRFSEPDKSSYGQAGMKGGRSDKGWHGESERHSRVVKKGKAKK